MFKATITAVFCSLVACGGGSNSTDLNSAPVLNTPRSVFVFEDQDVTIRLMATDSDNDELVFSSGNLPQWLNLDSETGVLMGTPTRADVGVFDSVSVFVSDGSNISSSEITLEVIQAENLTITGRVTGVDLPETQFIVSILDNIGRAAFRNFRPSVNTRFASTGNPDNQSNLIRDAVIGDNGDFQFNLIIPENSFSGSELLEIRAVGVGVQDHIELVSQVGSLDFLLETADENKVVSENNLLRLNISPVSTALAIQTQTLNGNVATTDWELIQDIERSILLDDLLALAADIAALGRLPNVEVPFGQSLVEVLTSPDNSLEDTVDQLFLLNNLFNVDGSLIESFDDLMTEVQADVIATEFINDEFVTNNLIGEPIIIGREFIPGTHPSIFSVNIQLNANGTGSLNQFNNTDIDTTDISWEVSDGVISIAIDDQALPDVDTFRLSENFGVDPEIANLITNGFFSGRLESRFIDLEITDQRIVISGLSQTESGITAVIEHTFVVQLADVLAEIGFEEEFSESPSIGTLSGNRQLLTGTNLQFEVEDFSNQSWAIPVLSSFGIPLGGGTIERSVHDLFGFNSDGTSTPGLLSDETFTWSIVEGKLEIETLDEQFTITPLIETNDDTFILVDRVNSSGDRVITTDNMTKLEPENIELFGQDFVLPNLTSSSGVIWQTGITARSNPGNFNSQGQLNIDAIFGWGFVQGSDNQVSWISGSLDGDDCLGRRNEECFSTFTGRNLEINGTSLTLSLQDRENLFRQRHWNVLSYDPLAGRARILEFTIIELDGLEGNIAIEPRINVFQLIDLADYSREYADSTSLFEVEE